VARNPSKAQLDKRWTAVKNLFERRILPALRKPNVFATYEGEMFGALEVEIDCERRLIQIRSGNCLYGVYNGNPEYDEGAYSTIAETKKEILDSISILKRLRY